MLGQIWAVLKMLAELWAQLKVFIGMVEKAKHEHTNKEIDKAAEVISNPESSEKDTLDAVKDLEDIANKHS